MTTRKGYVMRNDNDDKEQDAAMLPVDLTANEIKWNGNVKPVCQPVQKTLHEIATILALHEPKTED